MPERSPKNNARCHDPAGGHVCTPRKRIEVLLSERNPGPCRTNRLQTLPQGGLPKLVVPGGRAWLNPGDKGSRALALASPRTTEPTPSQQPDEPRRALSRPEGSSPDESCPGGSCAAGSEVDPLYLLGCGLFWRKQGNAPAGWELIRCLRAPGRAAMIAAALLAETENIDLPAGERVQAIDSPRKPVQRQLAAPTAGRRQR